LRQINSNPVLLSDQQGGAIRAVAFSPNGDFLAAGGDNGIVRIWNFRRIDVSPTLLRGHQGRIYAVTFGPNGRMLASAGVDKTIQLWNLSHLDAAPRVLQGHQAPVLSVAFSPDGQTLASGSQDGTIRIWTISTQALTDMICEKMWRNLTQDEWNQFIGPNISYECTCPNLPPGEGAPPDACGAPP